MRRRSGDNLLTHFQCDKCHFRNIEGRDPDALIEKDVRLLVTIIRNTLDEFWRRDPGMVKGKLTTAKRLGKVAGGELGLETWLPPMGPFPLVDEVGMSLACTTFRFSFRKGINTEHLQWDLTRKAPTPWTNL